MTVIRECPCGIAIAYGPALVFAEVNAAWAGLVSPRAYIGRTYAEVYPELVGSEAHGHLEAVFRTGVPFRRSAMRCRVRGADGAYDSRFYDVTFVRMDERPYGVVCHVTDVTTAVVYRKEMEASSRELAVTVSELRQERDLRERFVDLLTHDLRTPLTAAKMGGELLIPKTTDPAAVRKLSSLVTHNIDRVDQMIRDLLDASRVKAGQTLPIYVGACDLNQLVEDTVADLRAIHGPRFHVSAGVRIHGYWSTGGMRRILENLATNAVKYGDTRTPVIVTLTRAGPSVRISVHNEGPAITGDDQQTLFRQFRRTESARRGGQSGWGLGLTLVKGIAEAHGGTVHVESGDAQGTTFTVTVPLDCREIGPAPTSQGAA